MNHNEKTNNILLEEAVNKALNKLIANNTVENATQVNDGNHTGTTCMDFVNDVYDELGGVEKAYEMGCSELGIDSFLIPDEFDDVEGSPFDIELIKKHWSDVEPTQGLSWNDLNEISKSVGFCSGTHEWIHLNGMHYDVESPKGVKNFLELPFFQRIISDWKLENTNIIESINNLTQSDNIKAFMKEFNEEFDKSESKKYTDVILTVEKETIEVDTIWTHEKPNEGHGSFALKLITRLADKHNVDLTLSSSPLKYDPEYCTEEEHLRNEVYLDNESLINFYKKNGFVMDDKYAAGNKENPEQPRMIRHHSVKPTLKSKYRT